MDIPTKSTQRDLVLKGFRLAHKKLVEKAKRDNVTLVIERDGKIMHVSAHNIQVNDSI
jgi:hypothetical protein